MKDDPNAAPPCVEELTRMGLTPVCSEVYCGDILSPLLFHACCSGQQPPGPGPVMVVACFNSETNEWRYDDPSKILQTCEQLHDQDPNWNPKVCYCCCYPNLGEVATPEGGAVEPASVEPGSEVSGGSVGPGGELHWAPATVAFSAPAPDAGEPMVLLDYGDERRRLAALPDQVFMRADRSLVRAVALTPGCELVDPAGIPVPVHAVGRGRACGDAHLIATDTSWNGSPDGHLLALGGVVAGDYTLQLHFERGN
jgi:hypothetical protein